MKRVLLRTLGLAAIGAMLGGLLGYMEVSTMETKTIKTLNPEIVAAETENAPAETKPITSIGGEFELVSEDGKTVTNQDFADKNKLVFFGFTNCPDVCPAALEKVGDVMEGLGEDANSLVPIFVTVDPDRDTTVALAEYTDQFDPRIVGLGGNQEQIDAVVDAFKVYAAKDMETAVQTDEGEQYMMLHSAFFYVMNPENELLKVLKSEEPVDELVAGIKSVL